MKFASALLSFILIAAVASAGERAGFSAVASLGTARSLHTATLLNNGLVLVAGGMRDNGTPLNVCELYDVKNNTWTAAGTLAFSRMRHTATLLANGTVLVAGGLGDSGSITSAEVYDPAANSWSSAGNMALPRQDHTATMMTNGKILVAGGDTQSGATPPTFTTLSTAEIYDPASNGWTAAAKMAQARFYHTATLLQDGRILAASGFSAQSNGNFTATTNAETYDTLANAWTNVGKLTVGRGQTGAALVAFGNVLVAGGRGASASLGSAELFGVTTNTWTPANAMITPRALHTVTTLTSGKVLHAGGTNSGVQLDSAEMYDPATGNWSPSGTLTVRRRAHTATLLADGRVLLAGGFDQAQLASAEIFDPTTSTTAALAFSSTPTASPNPALTGQTVTFTAAATGGTGTLTYAWNFGDNTTGSGPTVTHAYAAVGTFNATLTVTDAANATITGAVIVTVNASAGVAVVGIGLDSDRDGFSDALEAVMGSDPKNAKSVPLGVDNPFAPLTLFVTKMNITLHFKKIGLDSIVASGTLPLTAGFTASGTEIGVDVAGIAYHGVLNANGQAGPGFKIETNGGAVPTSAKYSIVLNKGTFATTLAASGLVNSDVHRQSKLITVSILLNKKLYQTQQKQLYTARFDRIGKSN